MQKPPAGRPTCKPAGLLAWSPPLSSFRLRHVSLPCSFLSFTLFFFYIVAGFTLDQSTASDGPLLPFPTSLLPLAEAFLDPNRSLKKRTATRSAFPTQPRETYCTLLPVSGPVLGRKPAPNFGPRSCIFWGSSFWFLFLVGWQVSFWVSFRGPSFLRCSSSPLGSTLPACPVSAADALSTQARFLLVLEHPGTPPAVP